MLQVSARNNESINIVNVKDSRKHKNGQGKVKEKNNSKVTIDRQTEMQINEEKVNKIREDVLQFNLIQLRRKRNVLLRKCDWVVSISDSSLPQEKIDEWKVYRQTLRNLPTATEDPVNPVWPTPPQ